MVKVIMGEKGTGKTKLLIDMVNHAVVEERGNIVCIEGGRNLKFDIKYAARLIDYCGYPIAPGFDTLFAFICGIYAQNFDVSHMFIDSLNRVACVDDLAGAEKFIEKLDAFGKKNNVNFTVMISGDREKAGESLKRYF